MKKLGISLLLISSILLFLISCGEVEDGDLGNDVILTFKNGNVEFGTITVPSSAVGSSYYGYLDGKNMTSTTDATHKFSVGLNELVTDANVKSTAILIGTSSTDLYYFSTDSSSSSGSDGITITTPMPDENKTLYMFKLVKK